MDLKEIGLDGEFKHLDSTPVSNKIVNSMTMEATVEVAPQPLKKIKPFAVACMNIPTTLPAEAQIVLQALFSCFERQNNVSEGLIGDVMWGFENAGIPAECSYKGIIQLGRLGYIKFQGPDNAYISENGNLEKAFVRYQPKMLEMIYEK